MKKIIIFLCLTFCYTTLRAAPISEFIVFGDSLSDNGNLYRDLQKIIPKSPPYFRGRFSNGPTWAENVGKFYYDSMGTDYKIFAYGGATALWHGSIFTLDYEISQYILGSLAKDKSHALFTLWIGANDYLLNPASDVKFVKEVTEKISSSITYLINNGAKQIVIMNLPDLAKSPYGNKLAPSLQSKLHNLGILHNLELALAVHKLKQQFPYVKLLLLDVYLLFNQFVEDPVQFNDRFGINILNTTEGCWQGMPFLKDSGKSPNLSSMLTTSASLTTAHAVNEAFQMGQKPCPHADQYAFWDDLHPSEVTHKVLAKIFIENVN